MKQVTQHVPLRLSSNQRNKMSYTLPNNDDLARSQAPDPTMPSTSETIEDPSKEQVEAEQQHILQSETPVVEQVTKCSAPKAEGSFETQPVDTSSTPAMSSDLPDTATPRSSISPEPEVTLDGAGSTRHKRPFVEMAGPSQYDSHKFAKLRESLSDTQDVEHSFAAGSSVDQTPNAIESSHIASVVEPDGEYEEDEEMSTKKRVARKARNALDANVLSGSSFNFVTAAGSDEDDEEEMPTKKRVARSTRVANNQSYITTVGSDEEDEEEPPTKKRLARKAGVTRDKRSHNTSVRSDGDDEEDMPTTKGVARKTRVTREALHPTTLSRSSSSVLKTNKRSRVASVGPDEEAEDEPPTKKRLARRAEVSRNEFDPTTLSDSPFDFKTSGRTIYSETVDPRKRPAQPPRVSDPTSATTPSQPPTKSYLHTLPGELRNRIYQHLGLRSSRLNIESLPKPSLIVAYPDLKDELLSIMLSDNKLRVTVYSDFRLKVSEAPSHKVKPSSFGAFQVGTIAVDPENWAMKIDPDFVTIKHIGMRVFEAPKPAHTTDVPKLICEYFLNVRTAKGKPTTATHQVRMMASTATKRESRSMYDLATARAKRFAAQDGFVGFTWKQVQEIAASFESVLEAQSHFTKKKGKVILN
jgi:hypothetical protein